MSSAAASTVKVYLRSESKAGYETITGHKVFSGGLVANGIELASGPLIFLGGGVQGGQKNEIYIRLNALEERAKSARESAAVFAGTGFADSNSTDNGDSTSKPTRKPAISVKNIADVRRGFIWAKVLDEPRFKRRWSAARR